MNKTSSERAMNNSFEEPETGLVQYSDKFMHGIVYMWYLPAVTEVLKMLPEAASTVFHYTDRL